MGRAGHRAGWRGAGTALAAAASAPMGWEGVLGVNLGGFVGVLGGRLGERGRALGARYLAPKHSKVLPNNPQHPPHTPVPCGSR